MPLLRTGFCNKPITHTANGLDDLDTADLFTEVSRAVDKSLWFLEAHLQG